MWAISRSLCFNPTNMLSGTQGQCTFWMGASTIHQIAVVRSANLLNVPQKRIRSFLRLRTWKHLVSEMQWTSTSGTILNLVGGRDLGVGYLSSPMSLIFYIHHSICYWMFPIDFIALKMAPDTQCLTAWLQVGNNWTRTFPSSHISFNSITAPPR